MPKKLVTTRKLPPNNNVYQPSADAHRSRSDAKKIIFTSVATQEEFLCRTGSFIKQDLCCRLMNVSQGCRHPLGCCQLSEAWPCSSYIHCMFVSGILLVLVVHFTGINSGIGEPTWGDTDWIFCYYYYSTVMKVLTVIIFKSYESFIKTTFFIIVKENSLKAKVNHFI